MSDRCPLSTVENVFYTTVVAVAQDVCGDVLNLFPHQSYADICLSQHLHVLNTFKTWKDKMKGVATQFWEEDSTKENSNDTLMSKKKSK